MLEVEVDLLDRRTGDQVSDGAVGAAAVVVVAAGPGSGRTGAGAVAVVVARLVAVAAVVVADLVSAPAMVIARLGLAAADPVAAALAALVLAPDLGPAGDGAGEAGTVGKGEDQGPGRLVERLDRGAAVAAVVAGAGQARARRRSRLR